MSKTNAQRSRPDTSEMRTWIAEALASGKPQSEIKQILISAGVANNRAKEEIAKALSHPYFLACQKIERRRTKYESLLELYSDLFKHSKPHPKVSRIRRPSVDDFYRNYYFRNLPVILTDTISNWPALKKWSPKYFEETFGDAEIEVTTNRNTNPDYEWNVDPHKTRMLMSQFVKQIYGTRHSNDFYLVSKNKALKNTALKALLSDVNLPFYLSGNHRNPSLSLWFGPAGTITHLHRDFMNNLFTQIYGRKEILLIPSFQIHKVYDEDWVWCAVDPKDPDYSKFPEFRKVNILSAVLYPGEILFIPVGWFHAVYALDVSISLSIMNFRVPGGNTVVNEDLIRRFKLLD